MLKDRAINLFRAAPFRIALIAIGFAFLIFLRNKLVMFGISLGYIHILLIAISGFWFGIVGGLTAAFIASAIFLFELQIYTYADARDVIEKGMIVRLSIYMIGGIATGLLSNYERKIKRQLQAALKTKVKFISTMSHELRTPLAVVQEANSLLLKEEVGPINPEQKEILDRTKNSLNRLARLIDDILDYQKLSYNRSILDIKPYSINEVIQEVCEAMQHVIAQRGIKCEVNLDSTISDVLFDRDRITQVLTNLISNAIKFADGGSISISTLHRKNGIKVSVRDTGIGISRADLPRIFDAFEQLEGGAVTTKRGTGLGLAISKEIIEMHDGSIWAESELGKGTTIHFILPFKEPKLTEDITSHEENSSHR